MWIQFIKVLYYFTEHEMYVIYYIVCSFENLFVMCFSHRSQELRRLPFLVNNCNS